MSRDVISWGHGVFWKGDTGRTFEAEFEFVKPWKRFMLGCFFNLGPRGVSLSMAAIVVRGSVTLIYTKDPEGYQGDV